VENEAVADKPGTCEQVVAQHEAERGPRQRRDKILRGKACLAGGGFF
jgi:hypothetical protein